MRLARPRAKPLHIAARTVRAYDLRFCFGRSLESDVLYLADFNYDAVDTGSEPGTKEDWHGHFNMLVEADDVEAAATKLRAAIRRYRKSRNGPLKSATDIYMQSLLEILQVPDGG